MLNFGILEKILGIAHPSDFVYDFQEECFSCHILLTEQRSLLDSL